MTIDTLRQVPLFESLDNEVAGELCHLLESLDCKASTILFRAGDEGDAMYVIERGKIRICVRTTQGHELTLTELGRGDFFGEMALLDGQRRSADAVVTEDEVAESRNWIVVRRVAVQPVDEVPLGADVVKAVRSLVVPTPVCRLRLDLDDPVGRVARLGVT